MEKKIVQHFQMNFKEVTTTESGSIKIKGFASTPDIDRYDDIIRPEAYANAMATYMKNPVVLLGHDSNKPIGLVTEYNLTINGLEVTCEITNNEENCFEKIQNKTLRGFSIGWICNSCVFRDDGTRTIREVTALDLIEISVVATPANPNTLFTLAKSLKKMFAELKEVEAETTDDVVTDVVEEVIEETPEAPAPIEGSTMDTETGEPYVAPEVTPETPTPTEAETEEVETPTPEVVETPVAEEEEKSEVVEADKEVEVAPEGATLEEVETLAKSLIENAVEKAVAPLLLQIKELKESFDSLTVQTKAIEADVLKIEIPSHSRAEVKSYKRELTYADL